MKVRFTRPALDDLSRIHAYISKDNPVAASRVVTRIIDRALELAHAPYQGREIDEPNGRVIVMPRFRYFIFYAVLGDEMENTLSNRRRCPILGFVANNRKEVIQCLIVYRRGRRHS